FRFEFDLDSEIWRHANRWRGYGFSGYRPGARALYYWGMPAPLVGIRGAKMRLDRWFRREKFVNCFSQDEESLAKSVEIIRRDRPDFIVGFTVATAILSRYIIENKLRDWGTIPVLCAAEAAIGRDREAIVEAFGNRVFETYGTRETM